MTRYLSQVTLSVTRLETKRVETPERIAAVEARMLAAGYTLMDDDGNGFRWWQRITDDGALP